MRWAILTLVSVAGLAAGLLAFPTTEPLQAAEPAAALAATEAQPGLPADLALVPADCVGFVHVRLAEVWKDEMFAGLRKTWLAAGPKALAALDQQFVPAPSTIDRFTGFVLFDPQGMEPLPFAILAFSAPFVPEQVVKANMPEAKSRKVGGKTVYTTAKYPEIAVSFPDNKHVLIGPDHGMDAYLGKPVARDGPLAGAIKLAATKPVLAAANVAALPIPPDALNDVPAEIRPLLKAQQMILSLDLGKEPRLELRAIYADEAAAKEAEKAARALIDLGRAELAKFKKELEDRLYDPKAKGPRPVEDLPDALLTVFAIGAINRLDGLLADPKLVTRNGAELTGSLPIPRELINALGDYVGLAAALLVPAVGKVRGAAARMQSQNNLKQIGLAIHGYHDANNHFPQDVTDKAGKPILSWRVAILPYIEQGPLYNAFKMDEPWDGPNNAKLSKTVIKTFLSPHAPQMSSKEGYGLTSYKGVSGPGTIFEGGRPVRFADVTDGLSNTAMVVEAGDPIPWAKPGDYPFDPNKPLPPLASPGMDNLVNVLMGDGSVRTLDTKKVPEKTFKALFTRNGGEVFELDK
jgi:hypothetical protein